MNKENKEFINEESTESQRQVRCTIPTCAMRYEELEKARREFKEGKRTAESYWSVFRCYWSQFKEEGQ